MRVFLKMYSCRYCLALSAIDVGECEIASQLGAGIGVANLFLEISADLSFASLISFFFNLLLLQLILSHSWQ